jgi:single-stranded-DNA-specific exonuclease
MKNYVLREDVPQKVKDNLKAYNPLIQSLLYARGIGDTGLAEAFFNPDYNKLPDPYLLKNMEKAVKRILKAFEKNERIGIFSDYDADGIPGAVVLHDFFKKIGFSNFTNYIPLRNEEGFGLNINAVKNLANDGVKIIITIDCGITDFEEVELANKNKVDVIITDHHIPPKKVPKAFAIINPKQKGDKYPEKMICGAGVIFKVIQGIIKSKDFEKKYNWKEGQEKWFLDMVGLATLSDVVPLLGENRTLSYFGMKVLQKSPRVGLQKIFSLLRVDQRNLTEDDISFSLTPRINAASRMGVPKDAFLLLSTTDEVEAGVLAEHLNNKNDERKGVVGSMVKEIKKRIEGSGVKMREVLVIGNPEWKPSLLGLVANSFLDEHQRPVFFWGREGADEKMIIKGSCRSSGEMDVVSLMEKAKDVFMDFGGHKNAGGFSVLQENIHHLDEKLNEAFLALKKENKPKAEIVIDKKIFLDEVNWDLYSQIERFAPFGLGNPKPLFLLENIEVKNVKSFGKEANHLELKFKNSKDKDITAISFFTNQNKFLIPLNTGSKINLIATLEKSQFRNFPELRLRIVDIY